MNQKSFASRIPHQAGLAPAFAGCFRQNTPENRFFPIGSVSKVNRLRGPSIFKINRSSASFPNCNRKLLEEVLKWISEAIKFSTLIILCALAFVLKSLFALSHTLQLSDFSDSFGLLQTFILLRATRRFQTSPNKRVKFLDGIIEQRIPLPDPMQAQFSG